MLSISEDKINRNRCVITAVMFKFNSDYRKFVARDKRVQGHKSLAFGSWDIFFDMLEPKFKNSSFCHFIQLKYFEMP